MSDEARPAATLGVRVPGSTSNLGSGFDALGLAVTRYLEVRWTPAAGALELRYEGTLMGLEPDAATDLVVRGLQTKLGREPTGRLVLHSEIPVGRGLGSSGAAVTAGLALAALATGGELDRHAALASAVAVEGHPDNAAPALFGGLVGVVRDRAGAPLPFRLPLSDRLAFAYAAPGATVSTAEARRALPASVSHAQAVAGLGRAAALVHGLATADASLLAAGFGDDLHVPYRLPLIPAAEEAWRAGLDAGAWAVTVSGSGSGLFAVTPPGGAEAVAEAMGRVFAAAGDGAVHFPLAADTAGVRALDAGGDAPTAPAPPAP